VVALTDMRKRRKNRLIPAIRGLPDEMADESSEVTRLLLAWRDGQAGAGDALMDAVYGELRKMARGYLRRERAGHSLPPTALVHEAYLKLVDQQGVQWQSRAHFFGIAARVMRRILVDHARGRASAKRGSGATLALLDGDARVDPPGIDILALDVALEKLAGIDPRQSRLVELRFFGGLTVEEAAAVLEIAPITVKRDWALARTWLYREVRGPAA
jgi:RNA polymerase sigma factor (TIGR02999 family)